MADPVSRAALTLLDLDRREADDPDHPGMQLDMPGRRAALQTVHESGRLARRGDLTRYALAAVHGRRDRIPADAAGDPTVAAFLLGDYAGAVPLFARAADDAEARGQLAWPRTAAPDRPAALVALGDPVGAVPPRRWSKSRRLVARTRAPALGWQLLHHEGAEDALTSGPWTRAGP